MDIKYHLVFAQYREDELHFLNRVVGLEFIEKTSISPGLEISLFKDKADGQLMAVTSNPDYCAFKSITVLQSDNCLRDYYSVKNSGVNVTRAIQYNPRGLAMEFMDRFDNLFIVLEERDYDITNA